MAKQQDGPVFAPDTFTATSFGEAVRRLPILRPTNGRDGEAKPRPATRKGGGR